MDWGGGRACLLKWPTLRAESLELLHAERRGVFGGSSLGDRANASNP